jgi:phosphoribosyl 1,2-cyclic phosphodiesterase
MPLGGTRGTYEAAGLGAEGLPGYERLEPGETFLLGGLAVRVVALPHDAAGPVAFVISSGEASMGHATDLGHVGPRLIEAFRGCDAILLESNYDPAMLRDGPYPWALKERILGPFGHLSNGDVARYLARGLGEQCRRVVLAHLSQKNNHSELALMAAAEGLRLGGRSEVALEIASASGTDWIQIGASRARPVGGAAQLRLF